MAKTYVVDTLAELNAADVMKQIDGARRDGAIALREALRTVAEVAVQSRYAPLQERLAGALDAELAPSLSHVSLLSETLSEFSNSILRTKERCDQAIGALGKAEAAVCNRLNEILSSAVGGDLGVEGASTVFLEETGKIKKLVGAFADRIDGAIQEQSGYARRSVALSLFDHIDALRDGIRILDSSVSLLGDEEFSRRLARFDTVTGRGKVRIAMVGGYSTGKTTFAKRLLGYPVGNISPVPETWTAIRHSGERTGSFTVNFADRYDEPDGARFGAFLRRYRFESGFAQTGRSWKVRDSRYFTKDESFATGEILSFMEEAKAFPGSIKDLTWVHGIAGDSFDPLAYCDLFDLAGLAGKPEHDRTVEDFLSRHDNYDVVLYFLETSQGVASQQECELLAKWLNKRSSLFDGKVFIWIYQKGTIINNVDKPGKEQDWEELRRAQIQQALVESKAFDAEALRFLKDAPVLDARGGREDDVGPKEALARCLGHYYLRVVAKYVNEVASVLRETPDLPALLGNLGGQPMDPLRYVSTLFGTDAMPDVVQELRPADAPNVLEKALGIEFLESQTGAEDPAFEGALRVFRTSAKQATDGIMDKVYCRKETKYWGIKTLAYRMARDYVDEALPVDLAKPELAAKLYSFQAHLLLAAYRKGLLGRCLVKDTHSKIIDNLQHELLRLKRLLGW